MSTDAGERALQQLAPFAERYVSESLSNSFHFLAEVRTPNGGWGRIQGSLSDLHTTVRALDVFATHLPFKFLQPGEFEDSVQYVCNQLSKAITESPSEKPELDIIPLDESLEDLALATAFLSGLNVSKYRHILSDVVTVLVNRQHDDGGWGEGLSRTEVTAQVLTALALFDSKKYALNIKKAVAFLVAGANEGSWGIRNNSSVNTRTTALSISALLNAGEKGPIITNALEQIRAQQGDAGQYWAQSDQSDAIYTTGIVLRTLIQADVSKSDAVIVKAAKFLQDCRNKDFGWGWSITGQSETEPTSVALYALYASGVEEYVSITKAIEVLRAAFEEVAVLRNQNQELGNNIESIILQRIPNIISTKDDLERKVLQLEADYRKYAVQEKELADLRAEVQELRHLRITQLDVEDLLDEALDRITQGTVRTPSSIIASLETLIARFNLHERSELSSRLLSRALLDLTLAPPTARDLVLRELENRLRREAPRSTISNLVALLSMLPASPTPAVERQIRELAERIQTGKVQQRRAPLGSLTRRRRGFDRALSRLERVLQDLSLTEPALAEQIAFQLSHELPTMEPPQFKSYIDYLQGRYSHMEDKVNLDDLVRAVENVLYEKSDEPPTAVLSKVRNLSERLRR